MPRCIDANQIEKYVKRENHGTPDEMWRTEREFCAIGDSIPTSDVQEVKHGHWIKDPESGITRCSECDWTLEVAWESNYCPDCGAKMYEEVTK